MQNATMGKMTSVRGKASLTVILLLFGPPLSTVREMARVIANLILKYLLFLVRFLSTVGGMTRVIAKVIVGGRSHVDYDGFIHHSYCHFGAWGDVFVILHFFGPRLSTVREVARVIAKVIVGGRSHVDYDDFVHHGCCHFGAWGDMTVILHFFGSPLSTVRGVARVIVGGRSHVDYESFVHHGCCHFGA